jgi:hypothetical protein
MSQLRKMNRIGEGVNVPHGNPLSFVFVGAHMLQKGVTDGTTEAPWMPAHAYGTDDLPDDRAAAVSTRQATTTAYRDRRWG